MQNKVWRVINLIEWGKDYFAEKEISESRLNIELLLCFILKCKRFDLYLKFDQQVTDIELQELKSLIKRRIAFEPLQYIIGETEFMGFSLKVNQNVLIPRPETEILVEQTIDMSKKFFSESDTVNILDIGTGSGNIAISLAKLLPSVLVDAIDIDGKAIEIAKENSIINEVSERIEFIEYDILKNTDFSKRYNIIISNPPYINIDQYPDLQKEITEFEPKHALTDFGDGLNFYRRIAEISSKLLNDNGFIALEIAFNQAEDVKNIFSEYKHIKIIKDYQKLDRVVLISNSEII